MIATDKINAEDKKVLTKLNELMLVKFGGNRIQ